MMFLAVFLLGLNLNHRVNRALSGVLGVTGFFTAIGGSISRLRLHPP